MATTRSFSAMLREYAPNKLLREEFKKRNWVFQNVPHDTKWLGGSLDVPFKSQQASTVTFNGLAASTDIAQSGYVRGQVTTQPEAWASLLFYEKDLKQHGQLSVQNFLKILPDEIDDMMTYFKESLSCAMLNGGSYAKFTEDNANNASGIVTVDRIERFELGQKVTIDDDNSSAQDGYVTAISIDDNYITVKDARSGGSAVDLSGYTLAQNAKVYWDGSDDSSFSSIKLSLLSSANGGGSSLYGQSKSSYPFLQAPNISGASMTADTVLEDIFDAFTTVRQKGHGDPSTVLCSWKHLGSIMKILEASKGAYHIDQKSTKVSAYGWMEIHVVGVKGRLRIVGIDEMDDDWIGILDMKAFHIYSNGGVQKRVSPDGNEFYETRTSGSNGYSYIVDIAFYGDLVVQRPSTCGIIHSISY